MKKILNFMNLIDSEGSLSLTNLSLYVVMVKIPFTHSFADIALIIPVFALYAHKKVLVNKKSIVSNEVVKMEELVTKVNKLQADTESNKALFSVVEQQSNDAKRILAGAQNTNMFTPRNKGL